MLITALALAAAVTMLPGEADFCAAHATECAQATATVASASLKPVVSNINSAVNDSHGFAENFDQYGWGQQNFWTLLNQPRQIGDCKAFSLTKRHDLIAAGIPAGAMSLQLTGSFEAPHMVLVVRFSDGTSVALDNFQPLPVDAASLHFVAASAWGDITDWRIL